MAWRTQLVPSWFTDFEGTVDIRPLLVDGWGFEDINRGHRRNHVRTALTHSCGAPTELENLQGVIPSHNLNTEWQLLPDEFWNHSYEPLPGTRLRVIRP